MTVVGMMSISQWRTLTTHGARDLDVIMLSRAALSLCSQGKRAYLYLHMLVIFIVLILNPSCSKMLIFFRTNMSPYCNSQNKIAAPKPRLHNYAMSSTQCSTMKAKKVDI